MINLYDSPAQAQFINTYVPIQFEGLYKVADKAQADMDKGTLALDTLNNMKNLGSLSDVDNQNWQDKYGSQISNFANDNIKSNYDLQNPEVLSGLASLTRQIQADPNAQKMIANKDAFNTASAKVAPEWGDTYSDYFKNYDSTKQGRYSGNPMVYEGWEKAGDPYTKEVEARRGPKPIGGYWQSYTHPEDVSSIVNQKQDEIANDPQINMLINKDQKAGKIDFGQYMITDPTTGQQVLDPDWKQEYAKDMVYNSKIDATKGIKYDYDQVGAASNALAENRMYHNQMLKLREKEVANQDVVGNWANSKQEEVGNNKAYAALSTVLPKLDKVATDGGRFTIASSIFGPQAASFVTAYYNQKKIGDQIQSLQDQKATMQAKNQDVSSLTQQINSLNAKGNSYNTTLNSSRPAFMQAVNSEAAKTINPGYNTSSIFPKNSYFQLNTTSAPAALSDQWFKSIYGNPTKLTGADGTNIDGYLGNTHTLQLRSQNGDNRLSSFIDEHSSQFPTDRDKAWAGTYLNNFANEMKSGYYDNAGVVTNGGEALHDGREVSNTATYYIPASALKDKSANEYRVLKSLFGSKKMITKSSFTDADNVVHKALIEEYIPVPTYLHAHGSNTGTEDKFTNVGIMKGSGQGKSYYQDKADNTQSENSTESYNTTTPQE